MYLSQATTQYTFALHVTKPRTLEGRTYRPFPCRSRITLEDVHQLRDALFDPSPCYAGSVAFTIGPLNETELPNENESVACHKSQPTVPDFKGVGSARPGSQTLQRSAGPSLSVSRNLWTAPYRELPASTRHGTSQEGTQTTDLTSRAAYHTLDSLSPWSPQFHHWSGTTRGTPSFVTGRARPGRHAVSPWKT